MCLAIPGKVVALKGNKATIDYESEKREADTSLLKPRLGDYVIVSGGFVAEKVSAAKAKKAIALAKIM